MSKGKRNMTQCDLRWYVAQLKQNGFERAVTNLHRQNFETFMPMQRKTVRHARRLRSVLRPIFPGYLFIRFGAERADWRKINSTFGVSCLVSFDQAQPSPVPDRLVDGLRARCDASGLIGSMDDIEVGEKVRMVAGPFADFVGRVEALLSSDNVRLLFEFMGQSSHVDMSTADIERA